MSNKSSIQNKHKELQSKIHEISKKLDLTPLQIETLIAVYFGDMEGVGGGKTFWYNFSQLIKRQSPEDKLIDYNHNVNPKYVTQLKLYEFYNNMVSTQKLNQKAYKKPRATRPLRNAGGPRKLMAFDAAMVTKIKYNNYSHIIVLVDTWSRYIYARPIKTFANQRVDDQEGRARTGVKGVHIAKLLKDMLLEVIQDYGNETNDEYILPNKLFLISDNGLENKNDNVKDMLANFTQVTHSFIPPHMPSANARAESAVKIVKRALLEYTTRKNKNWVSNFSSILASINRRYSRPIGMSPYVAYNLDSRVAKDREKIDKINARINGHDNKQLTNEVHGSMKELKIGDNVLVVNPTSTTRVKLRNKFEPLWKDNVYIVHKVNKHKVSSVPAKYKIKTLDTNILQKDVYFREDLQLIDINTRFDISDFGSMPTYASHEEGHIISDRDVDGKKQFRWRYDGYDIKDDQWMSQEDLSSEDIDDYLERKREIIKVATHSMR